MNLLVLLVVVVVTLASSAANADRYGPPSLMPDLPTPPALGAYACVVHRTVGIQGDRANGTRVAGAINQREEALRFTAVLKKRTDNLVGSSYCAEAKPHGPERDFYKPGKTIEPGMRYYSDLNYWFTCKATYELQLSTPKYSAALRGDDRYVLMDEAQFNIFHLFGNLGFLYTYDNAAGGWYMEEGQRQKM